jgi:hypothetical protein
MKNCIVTIDLNKNDDLDLALSKINKLLGSETIDQKDGSYIIEGEGCDE